MNPKFQASVQQRDDVTYVKLSGVIDEDNELGTLADKLGTGTAVIDVSEIERINSCGVRDWVNWLEKVRRVETRDMAGVQPFKAPSCRCDECDGPMDFDDMEESYFAFLANTKKIVTDSRVDSVINEFTPTDGDRKIRSRPGDPSPGSSSGGSKSGQSGVHSSSLPSIPSLPSIRTAT